MKKIIRILFVCLFFIALIFIGKNVLKDGKEREYIKSDKYYEENIENININEVNFKFLQVNEVAMSMKHFIRNMILIKKNWWKITRIMMFLKNIRR